MALDRYTAIFRKLHPQLAAWHEEMIAEIRDLQAKVGTEDPHFVDSIEQTAHAVPPPATFSVLANSGSFVIQIVNPQDIQPASMKLRRAQILRGPNATLAKILHNLQSANDTNFNSASGLTDYGISEQRQWSIPNPNQDFYWRLRSSFDGKNWTPWQLLSGPSGPLLVSS